MVNANSGVQARTKYICVLILCSRLVPSRRQSVILCKPFVTRPGPTKRRAWSGSKLLDTLIVFLEELIEKVDFEKENQ